MLDLARGFGSRARGSCQASRMLANELDDWIGLERRAKVLSPRQRPKPAVRKAMHEGERFEEYAKMLDLYAANLQMQKRDPKELQGKTLEPPRIEIVRVWKEVALGHYGRSGRKEVKRERGQGDNRNEWLRAHA
jgi:hypothetical protein